MKKKLRKKETVDLGARAYKEGALILMNSMKEILDIKLHGETLKILILMKDNHIAVVKLNIDKSSFLINRTCQKYEIRDAKEEVLMKLQETVSANITINLKEKNNKINIGFEDITNQILDKFTEESEED